MRKSKLFLLALTIGAFAITTTSCSKKEGCTDIAATNYDSDAEDDDGSCELPPTGAYLKVQANMTPTLESSGCYSSGNIWKVKITAGPVSIPETSMTVDISSAAYEGIVTIGGFTKSGTYYYDIIDNYGDKIEDGSNYFSSSEVQNGSTDTETPSISMVDAGC
jgi:hypothetical protein